jgi:hypothetical protein
MAEPFELATVTANVNDAGMPAVGWVVGCVITSVGAELIPTVTEPDACPDVGAGVGVVPPVPPPPVAGGVVDPCDPTVAVTVAVVDVVNVVWAIPFASVMTCDAESDPAVVMKLTGTVGSWLPF